MALDVPLQPYPDVAFAGIARLGEGLPNFGDLIWWP
jgi:hypothetical protein